MNLLRLLFAAPLIVHGLAHIGGFLTSWTSMDAGYSERPWVFSQSVTLRSPLGRVFGLLWLLVVLGFVAAGLGLGLGQPWWPTLAIVSALGSLVAIVPWWNAVPAGARFGAAFDLLVLVVLLTPLRDRLLGLVA